MSLESSKDDTTDLDFLASKMIAEATSSTSPHILSVTGFARKNISIIHQQRRAANLAWALSHTGRVGAGDVVGVVGGSFSGLMIAVILSMVNNAIVYIFEKEDRLLQRFLDKAHRHLSPVLNSRALGKKFDPQWGSPEFNSPIFNWEEGNASDVAAVWLKEFATYDKTLPIFTFTETEVRADMLGSRHDGVDIDFAAGDPNFASVSVDLLVDATGYGEEANPFNIADYSYWESGHRLIYDHLVPPAKVLISGCGDSGVIEGLHYAFSEFHHGHVTALWSYDEGLEAKIDEGLDRARLRAVFANDDPDRFEEEVISEIVWWLEQRYFIANNDIPWPPGGEEHLKEIYQRLDNLLKPRFESYAQSQSFQSATLKTLEDFVLALPLSAQLEIRDKVGPLAEEWISRLTQELADSLPLPEDFAAYTDHARADVSIVLNGLMPTPYTRQLSPYNIWLMRLLLDFPSVSYRQGKISKVNLRPDRRFEVQFADDKTEIYDRVVTRYGVDSCGGNSIAQQDPRDTQRGDWLLSVPEALIPHPTDPQLRRRVDHARTAVIDGLNELEARCYEDKNVSKRIIGTRILLAPQNLPTKTDDLYDDPIAWLANELRTGNHPRYEVDLDLQKNLIRR